MTWWHYLLLVNIYLLLFYSFYVLLLSRETFFQLNRIYLVSAATLSFLIPLIQSNWVKDLFITQQIQYSIYSNPIIINQFKPIRDANLSIGQLLVTIYITGVIFLAIRLIAQLIILKRIIEKHESIVSYSFFKKIKIGTETNNCNKIIAAHEQVHASQWHSADVLMIEAVMIINWFNPVVYLYRHAIKHIHEFIADRNAVNTGTDKTDYALLLLSKTFSTSAHQLVNPFFNHSLLKQRIMMLQKNSSNKVALIKYGLSAPLFILMVILSSATLDNSKTINYLNKKTEQVFLTNSTDEININAPLSVKDLRDAVSLKDNKQYSDSPVFTSVEHVPEFMGGVRAFSKYLSKNIRYPAAMREHGIQGKVFIRFIVEKDGSLSNVKVVKGLGYGGDEESVRVLKLSPKWKPGVQNGKAVRVQYSVPITYSLDYSKFVKSAGNKKKTFKEANARLYPSTVTIFKRDSDTSQKNSVIHVGDMASLHSAPLYLLDGVEIKDLSAVNPNHIKSINVLKNATALYGAKGNNGAVIITSKKAN